MGVGAPPHDFVPETNEELAWCLSSPMWRLCSGQLYKIMVKSSADDEGTIVDFKPNRSQRRFLARLWHRNIILKARQLGFTTLICILWLDHALFNSNQRCGIVAHDLEAAEVIFRDKVKFAYEHLPEAVRVACPLARDSASELLFKHNNSSIRVATSMRSGMIHRLHISEFGKIGAKYPDRAKEVVTGSLPAVPIDGVAIIESTAEGQDGEFYRMTMKSKELAELGKKLNPREYRFHFFPWWADEDYRLYEPVIITAAEHEYFDKVEAIVGTTLDDAQRAWYIATRDNDFAGDPEKMWQEYPSYPEEAFQVSMDGHYFAVQLAACRAAGRITDVPHIKGIPVNTFWDIGSGDGTAVWLHQRQGLRNAFIGFIEGWEKPYDFFTGELQKTGFLWGTHYLPHDAENKRQQGDKVISALEELEKSSIGGWWTTVPRVEDLQHGIQLTRNAFSTSWFDKTNCKLGLEHLAGYKKKWSPREGRWSDEPNKLNGHSEAADAYRQFAQGYLAPKAEGEEERRKKRRRGRNWKTA